MPIPALRRCPGPEHRRVMIWFLTPPSVALCSAVGSDSDGSRGYFLSSCQPSLSPYFLCQTQARRNWRYFREENLVKTFIICSPESPIFLHDNGGRRELQHLIKILKSFLFWQKFDIWYGAGEKLCFTLFTASHWTLSRLILSNGPVMLRSTLFSCEE